jgi:hypothetical protein
LRGEFYVGSVWNLRVKIELPAHERADVHEVWLVHPIDRTLTI